MHACVYMCMCVYVYVYMFICVYKLGLWYSIYKQRLGNGTVSINPPPLSLFPPTIHGNYPHAFTHTPNHRDAHTYAHN